MRKIATLIAAITLSALALTACLPESAYVDYDGNGTIDANERKWREWELFEKVKQAHARDAAAASSTDCYAAIDRHWGGNSTAKRVMWKESRNNPSAVSPSGKYRGCMQMGLPMHNSRFTAVGCKPSQWANPDCNILAAMNLQRAGGWGHWSTY